MTETVGYPFFQGIAQKSVLRVRNGYVVYIRTDSDPRPVRGFVDDSLQRIFESLLPRIPRKQVHALAELFQSMFRLEIGGDNLTFRVLGIFIQNELCSFRLHDDRRDGMPRGIVNVLGNSLAFFERRYFCEIVIGLLQLRLAFVERFQRLA